MKNRTFKITLFLILAALIAVSCGSGGGSTQYEPEEQIPCVNATDCPDHFICDIKQMLCVPGEKPVTPAPDEENPKHDNDTTPSHDGDTPSGDGDIPSDDGDRPNHDGDDPGHDGDTPFNDSDDPGHDGDPDSDLMPSNDDDSMHDECIPGKVEECEYTGPEGTKDVGTCKAATRTCAGNGVWFPCEGEIWPVTEKHENSNCSDGLDNDCNGIADDGIDIDGDGHGRCSDCCETTDQCEDPQNAWDINYDACDKSEASHYKCDGAIDENSTSPEDYAKAIGICSGLISARILAPDGTAQVHTGSNKIIKKLGTQIKPTSGKYMLALGTGKIADPFTEYNGGTSSQVPSDWLAANNGSIPVPSTCSSYSGASTVHDAVMLELKIKVPEYKKSFSFDFFFMTHDLPERVCDARHDIFVALIDSDCNEGVNSPECSTIKNPKDKNIAVFSDYLVNVNLTKVGYMPHCPEGSANAYINCQGASLLEGTGFDSAAGTGWLTISGNVVDLETITLRLAVWDSVDLASDSLVLIDNFKWSETGVKPGIRPNN